MRVDKSDFYMHCRLHSLQAAVHFYVIGGEPMADIGRAVFLSLRQFSRPPYVVMS